MVLIYAINFIIYNMANCVDKTKNPISVFSNFTVLPKIENNRKLRFWHKW
jgi:hypothetical protein